jgi:hypothetical protein
MLMLEPDHLERRLSRGGVDPATRPDPIDVQRPTGLGGGVRLAAGGRMKALTLDHLTAALDRRLPTRFTSGTDDDELRRLVRRVWAAVGNNGEGAIGAERGQQRALARREAVDEGEVGSAVDKVAACGVKRGSVRGPLCAPPPSRRA